MDGGFIQFLIGTGAALLGLFVGGIWRVLSVNQYNKQLEHRISVL